MGRRFPDGAPPYLQMVVDSLNRRTITGVRTLPNKVMARLMKLNLSTEVHAGSLSRQKRFAKKFPFPIYRGGGRPVELYKTAFRKERKALSIIEEINFDFIRNKAELRLIRFIWWKIFPRLLLVISNSADRIRVERIWASMNDLLESSYLIRGTVHPERCRVTNLGFRVRYGSNEKIAKANNCKTSFRKQCPSNELCGSLGTTRLSRATTRM